MGATQAALLTLNAGSSSIKFKLFEASESLAELLTGSVSALGQQALFEINGQEIAWSKPDCNHYDAIDAVLDWLLQHDGHRLVAAGHRVVHGGDAFADAVLADADNLKRVEDLCALAPLHQPYNLAAIQALQKRDAALKQVLCFDTAFHHSIDKPFSVFALPGPYVQQGIRRYGFHGLSYQWIANCLQKDHPALYQGRVVVAHLGGGASLCALAQGRSRATTMGMTALDGLPMGTRAGSLDASAVLYLLKQGGMSVEQIEQLLWHESGLKGLSGISGDMRALRVAAEHDERARFAIEFFICHTAAHIAFMVSAIGGMDALVFTGGIGENDAQTRLQIIERLAFLPAFEILVIPANEERMIAQHTQGVLRAATPRQARCS